MKPIKAWAVIYKGQRLEQRMTFEVFPYREDAVRYQRSGEKLVPVLITPIKPRKRN